MPAWSRAVQRLLHPVDVQPLELARHRQRVLERPGASVSQGRRHPWLQSTSSSRRLPTRRAHRLERLEVIAPVAAVKAQLERGKALREVTLGCIRLGAGVAQRAGGGVGAHAMGESAEEFPARRAEDLAREVPQRQIERPAPTVVKIDVATAPGNGARVRAGPGRGTTPRDPRSRACDRPRLPHRGRCRWSPARRWHRSARAAWCPSSR